MDIWIIQDGEKTGPIHDFEIRRKIERGELPPETPAWHEGMDGWKSLAEIEIFQTEFERLIDSSVRSAKDPNEEVPLPDAAAVPPPLPAEPHLIRRFWARWFDLYLYSGIWWLAMWASGRDIGEALVNPWVILLRYVPWFALEAVLIHRFGTTPGKWLLGIRVVNDDGSLLPLTDSIRRCGRVLFIGLGFGWDLLSLICQIMGFITTKRLGKPLWDHVGRHRLQTAPLHPLRLVGYVLLLFTALQMQMIVISPYVMELAEKEFPSMKQLIHENPPWHLPKRN